MCGIAGYVTTADGDDWPVLLQNLNRAIFHRGPDDEGFFRVPGVGLAMRRLSIVDIAGSRQPISNEDQTVHVIFNGEIYNYVELRAELERLGHRLATQGDTEVLVHLYEEHGMEMLRHLRGMFAFALWDTRTRRLLLARDRLGKKPIHYAIHDGSLIFCSEIAPLLSAKFLSRDLDPAALEAYLALGYVPAPRSIFRQIRKLPPAHYLTWQAGRVEVCRYWSLAYGPKLTCDYSEAISVVRDKLDESIRLRLRSDVPLGLLLSGGLDSNAILARLSRHLGQRVQTFSIGFEEKKYDESELARLSARHFGADHHELAGRTDLLGLLPKLVTHYGEPFADKSALPSFLVCQLTRGQVKVALSGDGGDEAFAGYDKYRLAQWQKRINDLFSRNLRQSWSLAALRGKGLAASKLARNLKDALLPETRSLFTGEFFSGRHFHAIATPVLRAATSAALEEMLAPFWDGPPDPVDRMLAWDNTHYLPDDLLFKMDIASMAHGLEVRSPFLDHELVEMCAGLPADWKGDARQGKRLLRDIVAADLPPEILAAPKRGFSVPLEQWWRGPERAQIQAGLETLHPALRPYINSRHVSRLLDEHQNRGRNHAQRLWSLWVLNVWAGTFLTPDAHAPNV